jgi:hypothetical protein
MHERNVAVCWEAAKNAWEAWLTTVLRVPPMDFLTNNKNAKHIFRDIHIMSISRVNLWEREIQI